MIWYFACDSKVNPNKIQRGENKSRTEETRLFFFFFWFWFLNMDIFQHLSLIHLIVVLQLIWSVHLYHVLCRDWTMPCQTMVAVVVVAAAAAYRARVPDSLVRTRLVCLAVWCRAVDGPVRHWHHRWWWPSPGQCWWPSRSTTTIRQLVWEHGKFGLFRLVLIRLEFLNWIRIRTHMILFRPGWIFMLNAADRVSSVVSLLCNH